MSISDNHPYLSDADLGMGEEKTCSLVRALTERNHLGITETFTASPEMWQIWLHLGLGVAFPPLYVEYLSLYWQVE